jgi:hypothetical protein
MTIKLNRHSNRGTKKGIKKYKKYCLILSKIKNGGVFFVLVVKYICYAICNWLMSMLSMCRVHFIRLEINYLKLSVKQPNKKSLKKNMDVSGHKRIGGQKRE